MRSREFVTETAQESQQLNLIAARAARMLIKNKTTHDSAFGLMDISPWVKGPEIRLRNLGLSPTQSPELNWLLDNVSVVPLPFQHPSSPNVLGTYDVKTHDVELFMPTIEGWSQKRSISQDVVIASVLVHELQHALDNHKSQGRAFAKNIPATVTDPNERGQIYLRLPYEINARFSQALLDIARVMPQMQDNQNLMDAIRWAFEKNAIDVRLFGDNQQQYRRLLSRTWKFFDAQRSQPYRFEPKSLVARAWSWITGRPSDQIRPVK